MDWTDKLPTVNQHFENYEIKLRKLLSLFKIIWSKRTKSIFCFKLMKQTISLICGFAWILRKALNPFKKPPKTIFLFPFSQTKGYLSKVSCSSETGELCYFMVMTYSLWMERMHICFDASDNISVNFKLKKLRKGTSSIPENNSAEFGLVHHENENETSKTLKHWTLLIIFRNLAGEAITLNIKL